MLPDPHMVNLRTQGFCSALLTRVGGDEQIFDELCDIFLDDAPKRLEAIREAVIAGVFEAKAVVEAATRLEEMADDCQLQGSDDVFRQLEAMSRLLIDEVRQTREGTTWKS